MRAYMAVRFCLVSESNLWQAYVVRIVGDDTQTRASERTKIGQPTIGRWINGQNIPTEAAKVAAFAQGYERNVLEAFVAAGMLTEEQAGKALPALSVMLLRSLSDPSPSVEPAIAAHEDGSIAGEQESTNET